MSKHPNILCSIPVLALLVCVGACQRARAPQVTVEDLLDDRVALDGILMKCNRTPPVLGIAAQCHNARIAIERLAGEQEKLQLAKRQAAFERNRERIRSEQERVQRAREASQQIDPYKLPVVPADPVPGAIAQTD